MGLFESQELTHTWTVRTDPHRTTDEYEHLFRGMFENRNITLPKGSTNAVCASVVPPLTESFRFALAKVTASEPVMIGPGLKTGIKIGTERPKELGADLLANAAAAFHLYHTDCIVIDFGTALTFTVVSQEGDLEGVSIAPGVWGALETLVTGTAQLYQVEMQPPPSVLGKNTTNAIQSGTIFGYAGLVEGIVNRICREKGKKMKVIATGGLSETFSPLISVEHTLDPCHTLKGLLAIFTLNHR